MTECLVCPTGKIVTHFILGDEPMCCDCNGCETECDQGSLSWDELTKLSHAEQVKRFGWCICEGTNGEGQIAADCPRA